MEFIDFKNLEKINVYTNAYKKNGDNKKPSRIIITSTDIQKGEPVIFDTANMDVDADNILASASYPFYGIR